MATDTINFNKVTVNQALGTTTLDGTLTIDYNNLTVSGTITDGAGTKFSNFRITTADNGATYTLTGGGGLLATVSANYSGQTPTTTTVTYTSLGLLPGVTNGVPVTSAVLPCFVSGTLILTARGDVAVENLSVGDTVDTTSGASRPIKWLGHRTIDCRNHPRPLEALPIRISAHAFGENRPSRDLFVSPGHAICVDILGEVLVPAGSLVNGSTIQQVEVDEVIYWHVELDSHDVIFAENLPAESYLDMGNRRFFQDANVVDLTAGPDADPARRTHADFCRPFHGDGPLVNGIRAQLRKRAEARGWSLTDTLELHLIVDGCRLDPTVRGFTARFQVPAGAKEVWLVSPAARPSDTMGIGDGRDLGLCIGALRIDDGFETRDIAIDDPLLCIGFHDVEDGGRRWTAGRSRLPAALWEGCEDGFYLRVELVGMPVPRWTAPAKEAIAAGRPRLAIVA